MRKNGSTRRPRRNPLSRFWEGSRSLRKAPRRRDIERLEERQVFTASALASVASNPFFGFQWNLNAIGQQTEFDPTSPTLEQTLATADINVLEAWEQIAELVALPNNGIEVGPGNGVQVGIVSGGFDLNQEDLVAGFVADLANNVLDLDPNNISTAVGFTDGTDSEGTAIAGIIGARNNDLGIVGIAYEADLIPIRAIPTPAEIAAQAAIDPDAPLRTAATDAEAVRFRAGIIVDENNDGILDNNDQLIDTDGDNLPDSFAPNEVIDVFFLSGNLNNDNLTRTFDPIDPALLRSLSDGFNAGRSRWVDSNGDGFFTPDEVVSLGSIYVVPAGNDGGTTDIFNGFDNQGLRDSSQYNGLANNRFTIAVGAVPFDGRYENNSVGTVTSFSEIGANVLVVAPSGTDTVDLSSPADRGLNSGILTTDITGTQGANIPPIAFPISDEVDDDFFGDTDFTSTFGGTEAAAAQVVGVVAQLLQVNPNLSNRDVEQILLQSAQTTDQFSETWINNAFQFFQGPQSFNPLSDGTAYEIPLYRRFDLDTNGDGNPDITNGVLASSPLLDPVFDPAATQGIGILGSGTLGIEVTTLPIDFGIDLTQVAGLGITGPIQPGEPVFPFQDTPVNNINDAFQFGLPELFAPSDFEEIPLQFTNGAGFTISQGYGQFQEEIGYAHGLLDAGLALELARTWDTLSLSSGDSVSLTSVVDFDNVNIRVQPAVIASNLIVPGGVVDIGDGDINPAFFNQYALPFTTTDIVVGGTNFGEVITGGPFVDPNIASNPPATNRGSSFIPIEFDQGVGPDFINLEQIEITSSLVSGDLDNVRISIVSPSGTISELNQFTQPIGFVPAGAQGAQFGQGTPVANIDNQRIIDGDFNNGRDINNINDGSEQVTFSAFDQADAFAAGTSFTLTTNRHYGEVFSLEASNSQNTANDIDVDGEWYVAIENYGAGAVVLDGLSVTIHGREATGHRIQGVIGVDDNAQGIDFFNQPTVPGGDTAANPTPEQLGDGVFNFDRFLEFGELVVDPNPLFDPNGFYIPSIDAEVITVVLDDETDSIPLDELQTTVTDEGGLTVGRNRAYRTIDTETSIESVFPIISREAYFAYDDDPTALGTLIDNLSEFDPTFATTFVNPSLRNTDGRFVAGFQSSFIPGIFQDGEIASYRNFDYSQETFAAGVVVEAVQFRTEFNAFGQAGARVATGEVQRFVTGADGNYYFDVDATPAPPDIFSDPFAYGEWFNDFGATFEYEIRVVDEVADDGVNDGIGDQLFDRAYKPDQQEDPSSQVTFVGQGVYNVQLFSDQEFQSGETIEIDDLNFLLATSAEDRQEQQEQSQINLSGSVIRDTDGNGVNDALDSGLAGVTLFHDANNNNRLDAGEASTVTAADGSYELPFDPDGSDNATILVDTSSLPAGDPLRPLSPLVALDPTVADGNAEFTLSNLQLGSFIGQNLFFRPTTGTVTGTIFVDDDADGVFDPGEATFDGTAIGNDGLSPELFVFQDVDGSGAFNAGDVQIPVDANGAYQLSFLSAGTVNLLLDLTNSDLSQTFPASGAGQTIVLTTTPENDVISVGGVRFGVTDLREFDFGDLPDTFGTTLASNGPRHRFNNGDVFLGLVPPDIELDGLPTPGADGDDNRGAIDDEDGVTLVQVNRNAAGLVEELVFEVLVVGGAAVLNAFIDFNDNGVFDPGSNEHVLVNEAGLIPGSVFPPVAPVVNTITVPVPAGAGALTEFASRFRYGPTGLGPLGEANEGEVEDHLFVVPPPPLSTLVGPTAPLVLPEAELAQVQSAEVQEPPVQPVPTDLLGVAPPQLAAILDESFALAAAPTPVASNDRDNALLEWSLEPIVQQEGDSSESAPLTQEEETDESIADLALAEILLD